MKHIAKSILCFLLCMALLLPLMGPMSVAADEPEAEVPAAQDITSRSLVTDSTGFYSLTNAFDGQVHTRPSADNMASLTLGYEDGIGSLYLLFGESYGTYLVTNNDTGEEYTAGTAGFLHDFIDLAGIFGTAPTSVTLTFDHGSVRLNELYMFTVGEVPDYVQKWTEPTEGAMDMILFSTHGDDEQLFFAGLLPYYANAMDYRVLVVYLTDHRNLTDMRVHEMLNGLWAVGVDVYPVFGTFDDFLLESKEATYQEFEKQGVTKDDIMAFVVEQIRRYKPLVVVGHDFAGEYSHGQHMVYAECLAEALAITNDPTSYPELAELYGTWDVPKAYFHLYEENPIVMDWDTPMEELDGMTPFEVTQKLGFPCHESQQWTWFNGWINGKNTPITKASQIATYSPCLYGLYRSTVGDDVEKNDFFENLICYAEQERIAAEEEAQRREEEEAARQEAEQAATETTAPPETEPATTTPPTTAPVVQDTQPKTQTDLLKIGIIAGAIVIALIILIVIIKKATRRGKYSK